MQSLALDLRSYAGVPHAHDHPHHQVVLALEGELEMEIGGREGRVDGSRGALVPAGMLHAFTGVGQNRFVTLDIGASSGAAPLRLLSTGQPYFSISRAVEHLLAYLGSRRDALGADADHVAPLLAAALAESAADAQAPETVLKAMAFMRRADRRDRIGCGLQRAERLHPCIPPPLRGIPRRLSAPAGVSVQAAIVRIKPVAVLCAIGRASNPLENPPCASPISRS
jgi:hypothetical protein